MVSLITIETVSTSDGENLLRVQEVRQEAFLLPWFYFFSGGNWGYLRDGEIMRRFCRSAMSTLSRAAGFCVCFHAAFGFFASAQWVPGKRADAYLN